MARKAEETQFEEKGENNAYAKDIQGNWLYIDDAVSGRGPGYYCLGCDKAMQAVKSSTRGRVSYFRHDAEAVKNLPKCAYSDETMRHKLAKEILLRVRGIQLPRVYKYPPKGQTGQKHLLQEARFLRAGKVLPEVYFFETEEGDVQWGPRSDSSNLELLVKPDIAFFDKDGKPVLLVEIVVKHKVSSEKREKLMRLGIDAVQVTIPRVSPSEIEALFLKTSHTKWIYSNVECNTEYISDAKGIGEEVLELDQEQRLLFEEDAKCRSAAIKNLVRGIRRCLESKPYHDLESAFRLQISRVEGNLDRNRKQVREIQERIKAELGAEFAPEERALGSEYDNLEERYQRARGSLEEEEAGVRNDIASAESRRGGLESTIEERRAAIAAKRERMEREIRVLDSDQRNEIARIERAIADIGIRRSSIQERFAEYEKQEQSRFERENSYLGREEGAVADGERNSWEEFERVGASLEERFVSLREEVVAAIERRVAWGDTEYSARLRGLLAARGALPDYLHESEITQRARGAWECFKEGTWKAWFQDKL